MDRVVVVLVALVVVVRVGGAGARAGAGGKEERLSNNKRPRRTSRCALWRTRRRSLCQRKDKGVTEGWDEGTLWAIDAVSKALRHGGGRQEGAPRFHCLKECVSELELTRVCDWRPYLADSCQSSS
jgi:hypothetical protein